MCHPYIESVRHSLIVPRHEVFLIIMWLDSYQHPRTCNFAQCKLFSSNNGLLLKEGDNISESTVVLSM